MSFQKWIRGKARTAVDSFYYSSSPDMHLLGIENGGGWVINTKHPPAIAYCAGVGLNMSFELELAKISHQPVLVFDPSPTAIETVAKSDTTNIQFFPIGLAAEDGTIEFSVPKKPKEGSYSIPMEGVERVTFHCNKLSTIMGENGHKALDLLKMDIEGFEYEVIDQVLSEHIPIRQICVEFHHWMKPGQTSQMVSRLRKAGYKIVHKNRGDHTFLMGDTRYTQLLRASATESTANACEANSFKIETTAL
jgi:FkbM family methyltransferase